MYRKPSRITKHPVCSKECNYKLKAKVALDRSIKEIESRVNTPFNIYLFNRYLVDLKSPSFIAEECLGNKQLANRISQLLDICGIPRRTHAESAKNQWIDNIERRKQQSDFAKNKLNSQEVKEKMKVIMSTEDYRKKSSAAKKGKKNPMYGKTDDKSPHWTGASTKEERAKVRKSFEDVRWRKNVFARDNYICQCCGYSKGHILVAHHLNSWHWDINGRCEVDNGITLCTPCHKRFHKQFGNKNNNKWQMRSFLKQNSNNEERLG